MAWVQSLAQELPYAKDAAQKKSYNYSQCVYSSIFSFQYFFHKYFIDLKFMYLFMLFRVTLVAYGGSQVRGQIWELKLQAYATVTAMLDP